MTFNRYFAVLFLCFAMASVAIMVQNAYTFLNSYSVPIVFDVSISNVAFTEQQPTVWITTNVQLNNPSSVKLQIEYVSFFASVNQVWLTDEKNPPMRFGGAPDYVAVLEPNSSKAVEISFSVPSTVFPSDAPSKSWFFRVTVIIRNIPILGQVWLTRNCIYNGADA